ncbi:MAG: putative DNA binding domain-containing protein [Tenuifilaceae bacterium]|nr:putative DNA binding domain-containing protein [Tenuifilaceae bacterium]
MKHTKENIEQILQNGETEQIEFKAFIRDPLILSKVIGAFANRNGGTIIVGIEEPKKVIGCDFNRLEGILERTKSILNPVPKIEINQIEFEGKIIGIIEVEKSNNLIFAGGGVYERQGEMIRAMAPSELKNKIVQFSKPESQDLLAKVISKQTKIIEELRDEIRTSNSLRSKLKDYLIGGVVGAILGLVLTLIFAG